MIKLDTIEIRNDGFDWCHLAATSKHDISAAYRDLVYHAYPIGDEETMYISIPHMTGLANFYCQTGYKAGYGGAHFELNLDDGTKTTLVGPWSSREGVANKLTGRQLVNIAINSLSLSIDLAVLQPQLHAINPFWTLEQEIDNQGEISYSLPVKHAPPRTIGGKPMEYGV